jgi:lon-related putative ATP-dependent protease
MSTKPMKNKFELRADQLRRLCEPDIFHFSDTSELPVLEEAIGQERAVRAISFGIGIESPGYHMYALGPVGTGKKSMIRGFLEKKAAEQPVPDDWCYVNNFDDPARPRALRLPAGRGKTFQNDISQLVDDLQAEIPQVLDGEDYQRRRQEIETSFRTQAQELLDGLEAKARSKGFTVIHLPDMIAFAPIIGGKALSPEQVQQLDQETQEKMEAEVDQLREEAHDIIHQGRLIEKEARQKLRELDRQVVSLRTEHLFDELRNKYRSIEGILQYLDTFQNDVLDSIDDFHQPDQDQPNSEAAFLSAQADPFVDYRVNLIIDNSARQGAPVILEGNPNFHNLLGRIEHEMRLGALMTDFSMIKSGSIHRANGGYLMLEARDVLTKPFAWDALKAALRGKAIRVGMMGEEFQSVATRSLEPEPIPLDIKVIIIGDALLYYLLYNGDEEFHELFKVKADFATHMKWTPRAAQKYAEFIAMICSEERLKHFDPTGVARVVEESARMVSDQGKLATKFGDIVDLIRQASYWAEQNHHAHVTGVDVQKAVDERIYRSNNAEELLRGMIEDGTLLIDAEGAVVGQVNGISVLTLGDYAFGKPSRITARTYVGSAGMINIDRETELGGRIHNKGMMILVGYLGGMYAQDMPLALSASLTFEQLYEEVEGDSAASAELYALLSSLSGLPIRQDLAVTGSVNQRGQVQAIGGVNEKIEGFFDICRMKGLTGTQGVIIPQSNVQHLMLRADVIQAVRERKFHVYAISTVDQGIALLTGCLAGEMQPDGTFPAGTVNALVQERLTELTTKVKLFARPEETHDDARTLFESQ